MHTRRVFLILLLLLCLIPCVSASATWDNISYKARMPIQINNTGCNTDLFYHQVYFNLTYDEDMNPDFSDIIIYNNSDNSVIPYWNMTVVNESYLEGYINASYIPASSWLNNTYYLYFMNPSATSASDVYSTFLTGSDDFDGASLHGQWTAGGEGTPDVSGGYLLATDYGTGDGWHGPSVTAGTTPDQFHFTIRQRFKSAPNTDAIEKCIISFLTSDDVEVYRIEYGDSWGSAYAECYYEKFFVDGVEKYSIDTLTTAQDLDQDMKIIVNGTNVEFFVNDVSKYSGPKSSATIAKIQISFETYSTYGPVEINKIGYEYIRKYASPEPDVVFGEKEYYTPPPEAPVISLISQTPSILYANTTGTFNVTWGISHRDIGMMELIHSTIQSDRQTIRKRIITTPSINISYVQIIGMNRLTLKITPQLQKAISISGVVAMKIQQD